MEVMFFSFTQYAVLNTQYGSSLSVLAIVEFFRALADNPLLVNGLVAGLLASLACGIIGPYVVAGRIVFISGALAHIVVGGLGAAIFLRYHVPALAWLSPLHGAVASALLAAGLLALVHTRVRGHGPKERMDTLIGAMWAVGMAVGLVLIQYTPGYHGDLMSYLFGTISLVSRSDLYLIGVLDAVIVVLVGLFHRQLMAVCLDEEYAWLQGVRVEAVYMLLLGLVALTTVILIQIVGVILVIALLTLPAAIAGHYAGRLAPMMLLAVGLGAALTTAGRVLVYDTRTPPGPAIVLLAAGAYLLSVVWVRWRARAAAKLDRTRR